MNRGILTLCMLVSGMVSMAQYSERMTRSAYFETYKEIAISEMHRSGVPASITLAQGALESGDGNSRLARNGNNHFGIKCHTDWTGRKIFEDDDAKNECFRKYASVEDSYQDHSDYLRTKSRYDFLFEMNATDYKGWARGLKKAGYATSPTYAEALIRIIEEYNLTIYDRMSAEPVKEHSRHGHAVPVTTHRAVMERNRVKYVLGRKGDTYETVAAELGKMSWELPRYNEVVNADSVADGQVLYIQPKRNKAETGKNTHVVKKNETMYTIAQMYAIKLERLYAMNGLKPGTRLSVGTVLQLRKSVKRSDLKKVENNRYERQDLNNSGEEEIKVQFDL